MIERAFKLNEEKTRENMSQNGPNTATEIK
jgi:hypothetical protein